MKMSSSSNAIVASSSFAIIEQSFSKYSNELYYTVLNVWKFLEKTFWTKADSVILTSATLDLWDDFKYIKESLWIDKNFSFLKPPFYSHNFI